MSENPEWTVVDRIKWLHTELKNALEFALEEEAPQNTLDQMALHLTECLALVDDLVNN